MCGIIGYVGDKEAAPILLESLKKLEYRGYDSFGFATLYEGNICVHKDVGRISEHKNLNLPGKIGISHSRWATHGGVTKENSHPHMDCKNQIVVVHNGIVENYQELKKELLGRGHKFRSQTDTEVIAHLIEEDLGSGFEAAVKKALSRIEGRYALVVMEKGSDELIAVRRGSPLIIGAGEHENFVASDIPAFLERTRNVMYLDDNEMAVLTRTGVRFCNIQTGEETKKRIIRIEWDAEQAKKGDYPHFMLKEIMEQKETIMRAINQDEREIQNIADEINKAFGTFFVGCGTAGKVCLAGEYIFSKVAKKHVNFVVGSEFPNYHHFLKPRTLMITISQSGETADVLEAVEVAKKEGVKVISLVNVMGSTLDRVSDHTFLINAGPEKAVASTKATTAQLALVTLLAYASAGKLEEGKRLLMETASAVNDMLNPRYEAHIKKLAEKLKDEPNIYIIGRSLNFPIALESAIKIQEVSRIHAEGFAGGELKHGPLALIHNGTPCIALIANDEVKKDVISNAMEAKARGAYIIGISPESNEIFDYWIKVPDAGNASPIVNIIPVQILAYHLGVLKGLDPDYCVNLAKSVTVK
ncbi:MAG: glutamine--fructose-6-phosphate transaminase (isomerizing) [Candidatus Aenigmarchaeota archaeon]|nr:glutamine--fructose-6-phosphate transaminase (isomerizing) [Candidatus Aenigmarchaeota archaeon]